MVEKNAREERRVEKNALEVRWVYPGKPIFLSSDGNENYHTNSLILLIRQNLCSNFDCHQMKEK